MSRGKLEVHIVEGRAIKDMDAIGRGDPYVEIWLDNETKKHKTDVRGGTATPVWDKFFHYFVNGHKIVNIRVLDEDIGVSEEIGVCKIPLDEVYKNKYVDQWVRLPDAKSNAISNGEVRVILEFWPTN
ncbi:C2 domain-containing protein [Glomus cerebriforme]|uniref:C2 domain-containing protein n=1 Tax=Glomus cerebriforme TaxID=658196 RepID=A0A397SYQ3_9GLOM|nr:C2 domain-containing protein [Glomus cerebriforme]